MNKTKIRATEQPIAVDMELKGRIREAMIKKMRAFEVNIK